MHMNRSWGAVALGIAAVTVLAGCSGGDSGGGGDENTLTVWMPTQEETQKTNMDTMIASFEEQNPGVQVEVEQRSIDEHKTALRQVAGTDAGPDIYWYWEGSGLGGELVDAGMSQDLTDYYEEYAWEDRFTPASLAGITQYGGFHGVPFAQQGEALYYNKQLFEQAGVTELPTDYDGLVDAAEKLKAADITPIEFGGTVNWHVMRLLDSLIETSCGVDTADELNTADGDWGTEPCVTEAFTELKTWSDNYFNEGFLGISNDDASQLFFNGDAAMAFEGTWFDSNLVDGGMDPANVGIFQFPTETGRLYGFGEAFYLNAGSDNKDMAAKFLDYVTSDAGQVQAAGAWSPLSVNKNVALNAEDPLAPIWAGLFNDATGVYVNNDQNFATAETTEYWRIQNSVLSGDIDPADAGAEFQKFRDSQ